MLTPSHETMSIQDALENRFFVEEGASSLFRNYRPDSVEKMIENVIDPILKAFEAQNLSGKHVRSIKQYKKELNKLKYMDHTEAANRALGERGIIGCQAASESNPFPALKSTPLVMLFSSVSLAPFSRNNRKRSFLKR